MVKVLHYLVIIGLMFSLAGCKFGPVKPRGEAAIDPDMAAEDAQADQRYGAEMGMGLDAKALDDPNSPLAKRVLYFPLDSSQISTEDRDTIAAHAQFLSQNPAVSVILEGHADERGTREYNLALGERRAKAVRQLLQVQGVAQNQSQVISFGEERPVALDHDESAWQLNRRVEILYSGY